MNNVWSIKILSPEDVQKMGEKLTEPFSPTPGQRMNSSGNGSGSGTGGRDHVSGFSSVGSLEY